MTIFILQTLFLLVATFLVGWFLGAILKSLLCRTGVNNLTATTSSATLSTASSTGATATELSSSDFMTSADKLAARSSGFVAEQGATVVTAVDDLSSVIGDSKLLSLLGRHGISDTKGLLATSKDKLETIFCDTDIDVNSLLEKLKKL